MPVHLCWNPTTALAKQTQMYVSRVVYRFQRYTGWGSSCNRLENINLSENHMCSPNTAILVQIQRLPINRLTRFIKYVFINLLDDLDAKNLV